MSSTKIRKINSKSKEVCPVCTNAFTEMKRRPIVCDKCQYKSCLTCCSSYLLSSPNVQCMNCRETWSLTFLYANFSSYFVDNDLELHQAELQLKLEKSLLPEVAAIFERKKLQKEYQQLQDHVTELQNLLHDAAQMKAHYLEDAEIVATTFLGPLSSLGGHFFSFVNEKKMSKKKSKKLEGLDNVKSCIDKYFDQYEKFDVMPGSYMQELKHIVLRECRMTREMMGDFLDHVLLKGQVKLNDLINMCIEFAQKLEKENAAGHKGYRCNTDGCSSFLTFESCQYVCKRCNTVQCVKCRTVVCTTAGATKLHECDPDVLQSIKLIAATTRSCPSCNQGIEKIEGCDQMFCTACNTAFDWKSGQIIRSHIHNPHYFEWLSKQQQPVVSDVASDVARSSPPYDHGEHVFFNNATTFKRFIVGKIHIEETPRGASMLDSGMYHHVYLFNLRSCVYDLWSVMMELVDQLFQYKAAMDQAPTNLYQYLREQFYSGQVKNEREWKKRLRYQMRLNKEKVALMEAYAETLQEAQPVFEKLFATMSEQTSSDKDFMYSEESLEEFVRGAIQLVKSFNRKTVDRHLPKGMLHPTQDMLEFGNIEAYPSNTFDETGLVTGLRTFVRERRQCLMFTLFIVCQPLCLRGSDVLDYDHVHHTKVLQVKRVILEDLRDDWLRKQKTSSESCDELAGLTEDECWIVRYRQRCQKLQTDLETLRPNNSVYDVLEIMTGFMNDEESKQMHLNYNKNFHRAVVSCMTKKERFDVLYVEHVKIIGVLNEAIQYFVKWLGNTIVKARYLFEHKDELMQPLQHHSVCFMADFGADEMHEYTKHIDLSDPDVDLSDRHVTSFHKCCEKHRQMALEAFRSRKLPCFSEVRPGEKVEDKSSALHKLSTFVWIPDFSKLKHDQIIDAYADMSANLDTLIADLLAKGPYRCENCAQMIRANKAFLLRIYNEHMKDYVSKLTEDDIDELHKAWKARRYGAIKYSENPAFFIMEERCDLHHYETIFDVFVCVPKWFKFLLEVDEVDSASFFVTEKSNMYHDLNLEDFNLHLLLQPQFFTIYIDNKRATYDELVFLLYLAKYPVWTKETIDNINYKIWKFYKLLYNGVEEPKKGITRYVTNSCESVMCDSVSNLPKHKVPRLADLVSDKVRQHLEQRLKPLLSTISCTYLEEVMSSSQ